MGAAVDFENVCFQLTELCCHFHFRFFLVVSLILEEGEIYKSHFIGTFLHHTDNKLLRSHLVHKMKYTAHPLPHAVWTDPLLCTAIVLQSENKANPLHILDLVLCWGIERNNNLWTVGSLDVTKSHRQSQLFYCSRSFLLSVVAERFCTYIFASTCFGIQSNIQSELPIIDRV